MKVDCLSFQWSKDRKPLNGPVLTYNNVTFKNVRRSDAGVVATNFVLNSTTELVENDIGGFHLDVLCN